MKKVNFLFLTLLICMTIVISGCFSTTRSTNVKTAGIYANFQVSYSEDLRLMATAFFRVGNYFGTDLKLGTSERIYCNNVRLNYVSYLFGFHYTAQLPSTASSYIFRFERVDETIETELGPVPSTPTVTTFPSITQGQDLNIGWDATPPGDGITLEVTSPAFETFDEYGLNDDGGYLLNHSYLIYNIVDSGPYLMTVKVTRTNNYYPVSPYQNLDAKTADFDKATATFTKL